MIENFEEVTEELNDYEMAIIPVLLSAFNKRTKDNPVKAPEVIKGINKWILSYRPEWNIKFTEPRLRKCINYICSNSMAPLCSTSKGYFVSSDRDMVVSQIRSLNQRASAISRRAEGLKKFLQ